MKNLALSLILSCIVITVNAQTANVDTTLKFDNTVTAYERHWVVLKKPVAYPYYTFGYVYIQSHKGFMFKYVGQFEIGKKNRYILRNGKKDLYTFSPGNDDRDSAIRVIRSMDTTGGQNIRIISLPFAAILPSKHFKELKIKAEPEWVKPFYVYTDTLAHNYRWGCYYVEVSDKDTGIRYLEKVYSVSSHYKGVRVPMDHADWISHQGIELKLSPAYVSKGRYDKATAILKEAILNDPKNLAFYFELGSAYRAKLDWLSAIDVYKQAIAQVSGDKSPLKSLMASHISYSFGKLNNDQERKYWHEKSLEYSLCPSCIP
ncbi:MAG: hypothetical protein JWR50_1108 [Mucilaginibacter sp.]|nr:hypothetical protein [Mucilaginibacter sp.]